MIQITKLHAENFLSLRDFPLELGKLNVIVGPNACGKSNVVKAFRVLSKVAKADYRFLDIGITKFDELVFKGKNLPVRLRAYLSINGKDAIYEVRLEHDSRFEGLTVDGMSIFEAHARMNEILHGSYISKDYVKRTLSPHSAPYFDRSMYLASTRDVPANAREELLSARDFISDFSSYSFEPSKMRLSVDVYVAPILTYDGSTLARVLLHLYLEKRKSFEMIEEHLKSLVPEIEELIPRIEGYTVHLRVLEKGMERSLSPSQTSDGTLRLLAFITALQLGSPLVTFEEPEICVHPSLLEIVVDMLRKAPPQVIVTTHSPYLLDHVEPEEVTVLEKVEGETRGKRLAEPIELERVKKMLEEGLTMGEIWYSGAIGGIPE